MLLATLTANLQSSYAHIQAQIEQLQEQQRLIQAQLQRVGSVESKMESAAALVAEAISEIREVCPEELSSYQQVIGSLFGEAPIAQLTSSTDLTDEVETQLFATESETEEITDEVETVEVTAVEIETQEEVPADESLTETETSHQAPARSLHKQPTKPLQWLATKRGIDTTGMKRHQIASALVGQVSQAELSSRAKISYLFVRQ